MDDKPKSCYTCVRRRINCDLAQPSCEKCIKKGLQCPGYGRRLRWADGVAVRGKLKGRRMPVSEQTTQAEPLDNLPGQPDAEDISIILHAPCPTAGASAADFIDYYDKNLAGLMVWIDSKENGYRRRVLPLAADTPGLRFAITAFSAYHGLMNASPESQSFHEAARDACLEMVQKQLQDMNHRLNGGLGLGRRSDIANAEWMLACTLMIASYEMAKNQAAAADAHRQAARTLVKVFGQEETCKRGLFAFLRNQLSIYDVLASTTSFDLTDVEEAILPTPDAEHVLFSEYLSFLHQITLYSRSNIDKNEPFGHGTERTRLTESYIRSRFEQARGQTLIAAGRLQIESRIRFDFIRLVDVYHHAAVLYSYRCLGYATMGNADWAASKLKLFEQLAEIEDISLCVHNLPWPVFIAGTECHEDKEKQNMVIELLGKILNLTGFKHYADIGIFLTAFWNDPALDWRPLAQQFQENGLRIVLV
ncbi:hypothetical protein PT974_05846 [Cladobotryum mycophilum]|uniref:Zn(2)-C6 fungal-type domain-containing protein n=1 Tax=Cladobotryum mycophilum TaxID=491253 RepID=A0ABR0SJW8_9HYPO